MCVCVCVQDVNKVYNSFYNLVQRESIRFGLCIIVFYLITFVYLRYPIVEIYLMNFYEKGYSSIEGTMCNTIYWNKIGYADNETV